MHGDRINERETNHISICAIENKAPNGNTNVHKQESENKN